MNQSADFASHAARASQLQATGRVAEAEQVLRQWVTHDAHRESALRALVELYLQARQFDDAIDALTELTREDPDSLYYFARLAALLDRLGQTDTAIGHYQRLLRRKPGMAAAHYNIALLYKKNKRYTDALAAYEKAVRMGIENVQEVWSNMGVLYAELHQAEKAAEMYERALAVDSHYIPAMFNCAGLFEEMGERDKAGELYRRILSIDPRHSEALSRLVYMNKILRVDEPLLGSLEKSIKDAHGDPWASEVLHFALGKALDDLERYEGASEAYKAANELGKRRNRPYDRARTERAFTQLVEILEPEWIRNSAVDSAANPIFICGMFRSGSTLLERHLAAHPSITAGGELDFLPWLVARRLAPYPLLIRSTSREVLMQVADEYLALLRSVFPGSENITDKRPDNFMHLGLVKALFPAARIIYTKRNPLDNCLSLYFQQLGGNLSYATDLGDAAHYYRQHARLMAHWQACFDENIFTVDYDVMVRSPEPVLRNLCAFLGIEWNDSCLQFQQGGSPVKTASLWQVRENLHAASSGRWRHYEPFVQDLQLLLQKADA